jgi:hypothetical protein
MFKVNISFKEYGSVLTIQDCHTLLMKLPIYITNQVIHESGCLNKVSDIINKFKTELDKKVVNVHDLILKKLSISQCFYESAVKMLSQVLEWNNSISCMLGVFAQMNSSVDIVVNTDIISFVPTLFKLILTQGSIKVAYKEDKIRPNRATAYSTLVKVLPSSIDESCEMFMCIVWLPQKSTSNANYMKAITSSYEIKGRLLCLNGCMIEGDNDVYMCPKCKLEYSIMKESIKCKIADELSNI